MKEANLILEDGTIFKGESFGYEESTSGEVVFNTGMVGYPEALTDPSYSGQILVLTYPLIGNYGVPSDEHENNIPKYFESNSIKVKGIVVLEYSKNHNHWNSKKTLSEWLIENKIPAIQGVDTRVLTKKIREKGVMLGKMVINKDPEDYDPNKINLVAEVSTKEVKEYGDGKLKIIIVDCGLKNNILRSFLKYDVKLKVVPWNYDFRNENYDGLFISNGPGNPKFCFETINNIKKAMEKNKPIFGICLGHQLLALAAGASTYKLKYGHRSQNQPCVTPENKCFVTSQNHGYAVDFSKISQEWNELFINLNDNTNEGIEHKIKPFFSVQFHPEGSCGPNDTSFLFEKFIRMVKEYAK